MAVRITRGFASFYDRSFLEYAKRPSRAITIDELVAFNRHDTTPMDIERVLHSARGVHEILPIRLARRIMDIHHLPYSVGLHPSIQGRNYLHFSWFRSSTTCL